MLKGQQKGNDQEQGRREIMLTRKDCTVLYALNRGIFESL